MSRPNLIAVLGLAAAMVVLPLLFADERYYLNVATLTLVMAFTASAWNLIGGYQNQLALGHAAFFGIGAYTSTLLFTRLGVSPWLGTPAGFLLAAALSAAIALLCLRLKGAFYALATFALGQVVQIVFVIWRDLTRGSEGLSIPYRPNPASLIFDTPAAYIWLYGGATLGLVVATLWLEHSPWGIRSLALSSDEDAARALGVHVLRTKVVAAGVSGGLAAVGGTFYAQYVQFIDPDSVAGVNLSIQISLMTVLGGSATAFGPLIGAGVLIPFTKILAATLGTGAMATRAAGLSWIVYGCILVAVLLLMPEGIAPRVRRLLRGRRPRGSRPGGVLRTGVAPVAGPEPRP